MRPIRLTAAQVEALVTAGVTEAPEGIETVLAAAIAGNGTLSFSTEAERDALFGAVVELSNHADNLGHDRSVDATLRKFYRADARALANLSGAIIRARA